VRQFWEAVIEPVLEAARPRVIAEIGVARGSTTEELVRLAAGNGATVHLIDPEPHVDFDLDRLRSESGGRVVLHRTTSLDALAAVDELGAVDAALIDGDHNWYTVYNELRLLAESAAAAGRPFALTFLHDVDWPYGRRDLYYAPDRIPEEHRHPYARGGLVPGVAEPDAIRGMGMRLFQATIEGGPRNGVRTAVEDFLAGSGLALRAFHVPGFHGLMVLAPAERLADERLRAALERLESPEWLHAWAERLERARVKQFVEHMEARRALTRAQRPRGEPGAG
jgi:hypothetical protein